MFRTKRSQSICSMLIGNWLSALLVLLLGPLNVLGTVLCIEADGSRSLEFKGFMDRCTQCPHNAEDQSDQTRTSLSVEPESCCTDIALTSVSLTSSSAAGKYSASPELPAVEPFPLTLAISAFVPRLKPVFPSRAGSVLQDTRPAFIERSPVLVI